MSWVITVSFRITCSDVSQSNSFCRFVHIRWYQIVFFCECHNSLPQRIHVYFSVIAKLKCKTREILLKTIDLGIYEMFIISVNPVAYQFAILQNFNLATNLLFSKLWRIWTKKHHVFGTGQFCPFLFVIILKTSISIEDSWKLILVLSLCINFQPFLMIWMIWVFSRNFSKKIKYNSILSEIRIIYSSDVIREAKFWEY